MEVVHGRAQGPDHRVGSKVEMSEEDVRHRSESVDLVPGRLGQVGWYTKHLFHNDLMWYG